MMNEDEEIKVQICEVCGEPADHLTACRMCGVHFCDECGYPEKHLCFDCAEEVDEGLEDEVDETLEESEE